MASSIYQQIPIIIPAIQELAPATMLDIGKGFGKYGFLTHEFAGIPTDRQPDPSRMLKQQSSIAIDAVEVQADYLWPHIEHIYRRVFVGDITELHRELSGYDLVLMADVIEHLERDAAKVVVQHFLAQGSTLLIATPARFFQQVIYESEWETHRSFWEPKDFAFAPYVDWQTVGQGRVFLVAPQRRSLRGFGHRPMPRVRRFARAVRDLVR